MAAAPIDLSAGFVPKQIDLSAGMVPKTADTRNSIQKSFDENTQINPNDTLLQKGLKSVVGTVGAPFVHPLDTLTNLIPKDYGTQYREALQQPKQSLASGLVTGAGQAFGTLALGAAGGEAIRAVAPAAATAAGGTMESAGKALQEAAVNRANKTVGALQADFKHGSNLGRGYLEQTPGVSVSMRAIANKADAALGDVGSKLGDIYDKASINSPRIPVDQVEAGLLQPIQDAIAKESGIFGGGETKQLEDYQARMKPELDKARANGGFTPRELFDLKQKATANINWKSDSQATLNGVREAQYGSITGILGDVVPETKPLNQAYSDLAALKKRASIRADTGSAPLTNFREKGIAASIGTGVGAVAGGPVGALAGGAAGLAVDSIPVKTGVASALYKTGKGLSSAGARLGAPVDTGSIPETAGYNPDQNGATSGNSTQNQVQATPPNNAANPTTLKGSALWQELGEAKLRDHLGREPNSELSAKDVAALSATPQGKSLLIKASDLSPGSAAMKNLTKEIQAVLGRTK